MHWKRWTHTLSAAGLAGVLIAFSGGFALGAPVRSAPIVAPRAVDKAPTALWIGSYVGVPTRSIAETLNLRSGRMTSRKNATLATMQAMYHYRSLASLQNDAPAPALRDTSPMLFCLWASSHGDTRALARTALSPVAVHGFPCCLKIERRGADRALPEFASTKTGALARLRAVCSKAFPYIGRSSTNGYAACNALSIDSRSHVSYFTIAEEPWE